MADLKDAVDKLYKEYASCHVMRDRETWLKMWTDTGVQMPPGSPSHIGKENIKKGNERSFSIFDWEMSIDVEEVREADNWGFATGSYDFKRTHQDTGEVFRGPGKFLTVFEKQADGSWKIARDIFNFNQ